MKTQYIYTNHASLEDIKRANEKEKQLLSEGYVKTGFSSTFRQLYVKE